MGAEGNEGRLWWFELKAGLPNKHEFSQIYNELPIFKLDANDLELSR